MLSRRSFLRRSSLLALAPTVPGFLAKSARAGGITASQDHILVVIQLDGGNDGINTVVPIADEGYAANRKELRLSSDELIKVNDEVAFHPSMRAAADLLDDGRLAVVQGVGYPNPNRSHFRSMAIWQTARLQEEQHASVGWAGRALDAAKPRGGTDAILVGHEDLPVALRGRRSVASSILETEDIALMGPVKPHTLFSASDDALDLSSFVQRTVLDAYATADDIAQAVRNSETGARYPRAQLARRLQMIARLIKSDLPTRVYYAIQSGYDTHAAQLPVHARLLNEFSGGLKAFLDDLAAADCAERVVVMAFSEFGRRVKENGSEGTDHGTAGPVFLAGQRIKAGLHGDTPRLTDLEKGDLKMHIDFRQVYSTLLSDWLGLDPAASLGDEFKHLGLIG